MVFRTDTRAIVMAVREASVGLLRLGEGELYPALYDLEAQGWATTGRWSLGPPALRPPIP